jgi:ectoine hydroxylase
MVAMSDLALTTSEWARWEHDGFLVREGVFDAAEVDELLGACEQLCVRLAASSQEARKLDVSAYYVFENDALANVMVKWEPGRREVIQGVEPLAHLDPVVERFAMHDALVAPARELLGVDEVGLFTEKLNVKRAGVGGAYALHRDHPYWADAGDVMRMLTVLIALDDSTAANGALEVLPGSHLMTDPPFKESDLEFERNELDPDRMDVTDMVPVEVPAGSAIFFGPMLIHRSGANHSDTHRRALLYTYQRAGLRDLREINRDWFASHPSSGVGRRGPASAPG